MSVFVVDVLVMKFVRFDEIAFGDIEVEWTKKKIYLNL